MTNTKNGLPVAVHHASGGNARLRTGGQTISLNGQSTGSFELSVNTRYRAVLDLRSTPSLMLFIGYTNPLTMGNASFTCLDAGEVSDDVPAGTTVYFALLNQLTLEPTNGGENDRLHISLYG